MEEFLKVTIGTNSRMLEIEMTQIEFENALKPSGALMRCKGLNEQLLVKKEDVTFIRAKKSIDDK